MSRQDPQFKVRLPLDLLEAAKKAAEKNRRSTTAELVLLIERGYEATYGKQHAA